MSEVRAPSLYEVIEQLCFDRGINVTELCNGTGIARSVLTDLKNGRSKSLSMNKIWKIAQFFGVSTDSFFEAADD